MILSGTVVEAIEAQVAGAAGSWEVCGFVYAGRYIPLTNVSVHLNRFRADSTEVARVLAREGEPLAIFHSHPSGNVSPSETDKRASYYVNSIMLIGGKLSGAFELRAFRQHSGVFVEEPVVIESQWR